MTYNIIDNFLSEEEFVVKCPGDGWKLGRKLKN
jgi:hypothetical protein